MCGINGFNFKDNALAARMKKFTRSRGQMLRAIIAMNISLFYMIDYQFWILVLVLINQWYLKI